MMWRIQRGMSLIGVLFLVAMIGLLLKIGVALFPIYYDDRVVDSQIREVLKTMSSNSTPAEFMDALNKRLDLNNIRDYRAADLVKVDADGTGLTVHKSYERRAPFMYKTQFVSTFEGEFKQDKSDAP